MITLLTILCAVAAVYLYATIAFYYAYKNWIPV